MDTEKTVGMLLREARLAKRLSLAEAEQGTSIRSRYLEALERDEYDKTPGEVFLKGMIRNYGNYLGLDGPALVNMYKASAAGVSAEAVKAAKIREVEKVKLNIQLKDPRDIGSGTGRFELPHVDLKQVLAGVGVLVVLAGGYFAIPKAVDYFQNRPQSVASAPKEQPVAKDPVVWDKVQVEIEATGDCWLEAQADGKEIFAGMLRAKDKKSLEAKDKLIVKYGNIGVMKIVFNGKSVDLQGEHGVAVKTYTLHGSQNESRYVKAVSVEADGAKVVQPAQSAVPQAAKPMEEKAKPAETKPANVGTKATETADTKVSNVEAKANNTTTQNAKAKQ